MHHQTLSQQLAPPACNRLASRLIALLLFLTAPALASDLPAPVAAALKQAGIPERSVAVVVQGVDQSQPLLRHNALHAMNPASTMKLVTTYAALELLGPAYTWKTEALTDALPPNGQSTLTGNVYLRGSGDPRLALEQFWLLLRQLRARGVATIAGDLVLDRSAFALPPHDPAAFDDEPLRPYNAGPDALLINLKSIRLTLHPDSQAISVISETPDDELRVDNRLQLTTDACGDWRERIKVKVDGPRIELSGSFSASCGDKALSLSPWSANVQVEQLFRTLWRELGGTLRGSVRDGLTPPAARQLALAESPPLAEVVREINKYSNNVMARQLFLTLSGERPASTESARRRLSAWLAGKPLQLPGLVLDNGSGLSRSERISADGLAQLLRAAWNSPVMPELMASLPLAGVDGTLKKRLTNSAATGRAHLKTGYLEEVRAIAGYAQDRHDKRWVVVFLINDPKSRLGKPAIDALLQWVAER